MANWDEIKQLAADFQRTQTSDTLQKLSERNCIDIVKKLTSLNLIELIYTCDGKEFITPTHLRKEIEDEIYINKGRMQLHDLAARLNVDFQHIENQAKELASARPEDYTIILGQIIHSSYKITLSKLINEYMLTKGQLGIAEFAKTLDLPSEFLCTMVRELMPSVIEDFIASPDERIYYTAETVDLYRSIVSGTLTAICKPTTIASLIKRLNIPERIVMTCIEALIKEGRLDGKVENRLFIPSIYARAQNEWIEKFYQSNYYIEFDVISRMDIKQPKIFLKKKFPDGISLKSCLISPQLVSQVESLVEEYISSNSWIDVTTIVPSVLEQDDIDQILQLIFVNKKHLNTSCIVFNKVNVLSLGCISACKSIFEDSMQSKANEDLNVGKLHEYFLGIKKEDLKKSKDKEETSERQGDEQEQEAESVPEQPDQEKNEQVQSPPNKGEANEDDGLDLDDFSDQRRKGKKGAKDRKSKANESVDSKSRKSGGGTQGREIKQKAVKKKYLPGNKGNEKRTGGKEKNARVEEQEDVYEEKEPLSFLSTEEIIRKIQANYRNDEEFSYDLLNDIAETIEPDLNRSYEQLAKRTLDESLKEDADESVKSE